MNRRPLRGSGREKWYFIGAVALIAMAAAAILAAVLFPKEEELSQNLCPLSGPTGHVILLVDATDPFTFTQSKALAQLVEQMAQPARTPQGTLLTVYVFGDDVKAGAAPMFERCSPGSGAGKSEVTHTLKLWQERYAKEFQDPLIQKVPEMQPKVSAPRSPIMQMLQIVSLSFKGHAASGERRLIIVSDLLQNTPELSLYREIPPYAQFRDRADARRLRAELGHVVVDAELLLNTPQIQNRRFLKFWEDYFSDMGTRSFAVNPIPG
jgi:hypothetical protein